MLSNNLIPFPATGYYETQEDETATADSLREIQSKLVDVKEQTLTQNEKVYKNITLSNIGVIGYKLIEPLQVNLDFEDDVCIASSYDLNMFGYGDTEADAIQDLRESIVEYYEDLSEDQENLDVIPQTDFEYLKSILQKRSKCS